MRTFMFLTAILLMTMQAKAEPVPPTDDEALGQERSEVEDQSMAGPVSTDSETVLQDPGHGRTLICKCKRFCFFPERKHSHCLLEGQVYNNCCKLAR